MCPLKRHSFSRLGKFVSCPLPYDGLVLLPFYTTIVNLEDLTKSLKGYGLRIISKQWSDAVLARSLMNGLKAWQGSMARGGGSRNLLGSTPLSSVAHSPVVSFWMLLGVVMPIHSSRQAGNGGRNFFSFDHRKSAKPAWSNPLARRSRSSLSGKVQPSSSSNESARSLVWTQTGLMSHSTPVQLDQQTSKRAGKQPRLMMSELVNFPEV